MNRAHVLIPGEAREECLQYIRAERNKQRLQFAMRLGEAALAAAGMVVLFTGMLIPLLLL